MSAHGKNSHPAHERANRVFAAVEQFAARLGVTLVCVALVLFVSGWLSPLIPVDKLLASWGLPVGEFARLAGAPAGWQLLGQWWHSDMLGLAGLLLLAGAAIGAYAALLPILLRDRDFIYLALVILQIAVFVLAASGWLTAH